MIAQKIKEYATIAQLVEQGTENPCVLGSIPSCGIFFCTKFSITLWANLLLVGNCHFPPSLVPSRVKDT